MKLKAVVDTLDGVPEEFHSLYTENNGKFEITGIEGMRTQADVDRVSGALTKERNDHKALRNKFQAFGDREPEEILSILDRVPELEAAAAGKLDDNKINSIVEQRISSKTAPILRERDALAKQVSELTAAVDAYKQKEVTQNIHNTVRDACVKAGLVPDAVEDALILSDRVFTIDETGRVVTKDGVNVTPGLDPAVWLTEMQSKRPHWWPASQGSGASGGNTFGGGGTNPFSRAGWNLTAQASLVTQDRSKAEQLAKAAGTTIGGPIPAK